MSEGNIRTGENMVVDEYIGIDGNVGTRESTHNLTLLKIEF